MLIKRASGIIVLNFFCNFTLRLYFVISGTVRCCLEKYQDHFEAIVFCVRKTEDLVSLVNFVL